MKQKGFTLIEVMIVVTVLGILMAIAVPSYKDYIIKSRRVDAKDALTAMQFAQEKWRSNNTAYSTSVTDLGVSTNSPQSYYTVAVTAASATAFTAVATATGVQAVDTVCPTLTVTEQGFSSTQASCWGTK